MTMDFRSCFDANRNKKNSWNFFPDNMFRGNDNLPPRFKRQTNFMRLNSEGIEDEWLQKSHRKNVSDAIHSLMAPIINNLQSPADVSKSKLNPEAPEFVPTFYNFSMLPLVQYTAVTLQQYVGYQSETSESSASSTTDTKTKDSCDAKPTESRTSSRCSFCSDQKPVVVEPRAVPTSELTQSELEELLHPKPKVRNVKYKPELHPRAMKRNYTPAPKSTSPCKLTPTMRKTSLSESSDFGATPPQCKPVIYSCSNPTISFILGLNDDADELSDSEDWEISSLSSDIDDFQPLMQTSFGSPFYSNIDRVNRKWRKLNPDKPDDVVHDTKVHFANDEKLTTVHNMVVWLHAYRQARCGPWEVYARDRERFRDRIDSVAPTIETILTDKHRNRCRERIERWSEEHERCDSEGFIKVMKKHRKKK